MGFMQKPAAIPEPRRDGMMFVVSPESALPCRCIKCNADCSPMRISTRISTLSAWYPLFSSAGWNAHCADDLPIFITFSLCLRHRFELLGRLALIVLLAIANLICLLTFELTPKVNPAIEMLTAILPLLFILTALTLRPTLRPRRVYHGLAWFAGAGLEFLNSLPEIELKTASIS
jgi:hypothetical protein